ncbi:hypothetical protein [Pseudomonas laurentiana]
MRIVAGHGISFLAGVSILVVAPSYFLYQTMVQAGFFAPVLKGFFTVGMLVTLPLLILYVFARFKLGEFLRRRTFQIFIVFMLMFFALALFASLSGVDADIAYYIQLSFVRFVYMFCLALALVRMEGRLSRFIYYFICGYSLFVILSSSGGFVRPPAWYGAYLFEFDYQQIAFCYLVFSMVLLPSLGAFRRYFYYLLVIPALYLIGARSEFFAFFFLIAIVETVRNWRLSLFVFLVMLVAGAVGLAVTDLSLLKNIRMFSIFFEGADLSADARTTYAINAYDQIAQSPLWGGFASHPAGEYIHNLLAVWVDMGLFGLVVYLSMLLVPLSALLIFGLNAHLRPDWLRAFCFVSVTLFLLVLAKTYTYGLVPMAVAVYCVYRSGSTSETLKSRLDW